MRFNRDLGLVILGKLLGTETLDSIEMRDNANPVVSLTVFFEKLLYLLCTFSYILPCLVHFLTFHELCDTFHFLVVEIGLDFS